MTAQQQGMIFETDIYNGLIARKYETVQREPALKAKYGIKAFAVDILISHRGLHAAIQVKYAKQSKLDAVQRLDHAAEFIHKEITETIGHIEDELITIMITKNAYSQSVREQFKNIIFIHQTDPQKNFVDAVLEKIDLEFADVMKPDVLPITNLDAQNITIADLKDADHTHTIVRFKHQRDVDNSRIPMIQKWFLSTWQPDEEGAFIFPEVILHFRDGVYSMIDGQHRLRALIGIPIQIIASTEGLAKWRIPVRVIRNRTDAQLIAIFRNINSCKPVNEIYIDPSQLSEDIVIAFKQVSDEFSDFTVSTTNPRFPHINIESARNYLKGSMLLQNLLSRGKIKSVQDVGDLIIQLNKKMKLELSAAEDKAAIIVQWGGFSKDIEKDIQKIKTKGICYLAFVKNNAWLELLKTI